MATPINQIGQHELNPLLNVWAKAGGTTDDADWMRSGENIAFVQAFIREQRGLKFVDEEVESEYTYPSGYNGAGPIAVQVDRLKTIFPSLGTANIKLAEVLLPGIAEGYFAFPRWETIAPTYGEAVEIVIAKIAETCHLSNLCEGKLGPQFLRQSARSVEFWKKLAEQQKGHDILVVPAQFGLRHRGRSVRRVREVFGATEFGLGAFAVGCMLFTHPERLVSCDDLWIDCAGDEYADYRDDSFVLAPRLCFGNEGLLFGASDHASQCFGGYGSATAFLPMAA